MSVSYPAFLIKGGIQIDLLNGNIKTLYRKYLSAAFGSALISCIYGMVDMAMVGQYQGPDGTAALAAVAPVWNVIYSLGLLMGIGGSIIFSTRRGAEGSGGNRFVRARRDFVDRHSVLRSADPDLLRRGRTTAAAGDFLPAAG